MNEFDAVLLCVALIYTLCIYWVFLYSNKKYADKLNPLVVLCYFSILDAFSLIWFAMRPELREMLIYSQISTDAYKSEYVVLVSYALSLVGFLCIVGGLYAVLPRNDRGAFLKINSRIANKAKWYGFLIWMSGLLIASYLVISNGGIANLWREYVLLGKELENVGYLNLIYQGFVLIGGGVLYIDLYNKKFYIRLILMLSISLCALSIFGNRSPLLLFILMILFAHNYKIKRIDKILNKTTLAVGVGFLCLALLLVGLRPGSETYLIGEEASIEEKLSRDLIMRVGTLERKMVVIGYFDLDKIWYGKSYYSLVVAPIPRSILADKPPVDTGIYLKEIAEGGEPQVNASTDKLTKTSWPEGNLAGWMNFHVIGYVFLSMLTGLMYGVFYKKMIIATASTSSIFIYINLCYWGAPNLSPYGAVKILSTVLVVLIIHVLYRLFISKSKYL